jgi:hypothetical protein
MDINETFISRGRDNQEPYWKGWKQKVTTRALALTRISPVAWQHILLNGHYTFQSSNEIIDLDALVAGLKLRYRNFGGSGVEPP